MVEKHTEQKILDAARKLFIQKGMDGTKMQEIADEAGINKSLLHYYFRSKNKLFDQIFHEVFVQLFPKLQLLIDSSKSLDDRITFFVDEYISVMQANPFLPLFILGEIQRDPDRLHDRFRASGLQPEMLLNSMALSMGITIEEVRMLIVNILALCIFPFAARPLLSRVLYDGDESVYDQFLEQRKAMVAQFVLNAIKK